MGDFKQRVGDITQQTSLSVLDVRAIDWFCDPRCPGAACDLAHQRPLKLIFADGTSKIEIHKAGGTEWTTAQRHAGENVADTSLEFMAVQMK